MSADDSRATMRDHLANLLTRADSTDPDDAIHDESPLSVERSGKYVAVLFSTGGPHTEFLAEYDDDDAADAWFENEPQGGWFTFKDWGTREDVYVSSYDAGRIMTAIMRDADEMTELDNPCSQCETEEAEDYGMCPSCEHNARRSGWNPGDPS